MTFQTITGNEAELLGVFEIARFSISSTSCRRVRWEFVAFVPQVFASKISGCFRHVRVHAGVLRTGQRHLAVGKTGFT